MAKAKKVLTPAEIKAQKAELNKLVKSINDDLKPFQADVSVAIKALAAAKKDADKIVDSAQKVVDAAIVKAAKAAAAAAEGIEKVNAQLAALEPAV